MNHDNFGNSNDDGFSGDRDDHDRDRDFERHAASGPDDGDFSQSTSAHQADQATSTADEGKPASGAAAEDDNPKPGIQLLGGPSADFIDVEARLRPELDMEKILAALREDSNAHKHDSDYVFNHGPLESFSHQINETLKNAADIPEVAEAFQTHVNRAFHLAVGENYTALFNADGAPRLDNSEEGLSARLLVLDSMVMHYKSLASPLAADLAMAGYRSQEMIDSVSRAVEFERRRIAMLQERLAPPTIGESLFNSLKQTAGKLFANGDVAGDVRDYQNRNIAQSLRSLRDIGTEIRHNAGNRDWIGANGQRAMDESERLQKGLKQITDGLGTRLNHRAIKTQLDEIKDIFSSASLTVDDEEFKKKLKAFAESIVAMVERMVTAVQKRFSAFGGSPSPT